MTPTPHSDIKITERHFTIHIQKTMNETSFKRALIIGETVKAITDLCYREATKEQLELLRVVEAATPEYIVFAARQLEKIIESKAVMRALDSVNADALSKLQQTYSTLLKTAKKYENAYL